MPARLAVWPLSTTQVSAFRSLREHTRVSRVVAAEVGQQRHAEQVRQRDIGDDRLNTVRTEPLVA